MSTDSRVGSVLQDRYRVFECLDSGAMGSVYRGERLGLGRPVAIKFLHSGLAMDAGFSERFKREAMTMSRLDHPNCVSVIDAGFDEAPYIVMDYVRGRSVRDVLADGPLEVSRAVAITQQILAGLAHAHSHDIVHRDIKPANLMLSEVEGAGEQVRILDFGLAKFRSPSVLDDADVSVTGVAVGTPSYMSPEQTLGGTLDSRTDLYSVGVVLFELLTGRKPFTGDQPYDIIVKHLHEPPPPVRTAGEQPIPRALEAVIHRAMAKSPEDRFATADEFSSALAGVAAGATGDREDSPPVPAASAKAGAPAASGQPPDVAPRPTADHPRGARRPWRLLATVVALCVVAGVLASPQVRGWLLSVTDRAVDELHDHRSSEPPPPGPTRVASVAEAQAVARAGHRDDAIQALHALRRDNIEPAEASRVLGELYFEKDWRAEGIAAYREAVQRNPALASDPTLIANVTRALEDAHAEGLARQFLVSTVGPPALPALRQLAASTEIPGTKRRVRKVIREIELRRDHSSAR